MSTTHFQIPDNSETPFAALPFWQFLDAIGKPALRASRKDGFDLKCEYLASLGFVKGRDTVSEESLRLLRMVLEHFWCCAPELPARKVADVFTPSSGPDSYYVQGMPRRQSVAQDVSRALRAAGWVHEVNPHTTFFEVVNGFVWAKYQSILGDRCLCRLIAEKVTQ